MMKRIESFLLHMLMLAAVLGAMCFVGAYAEEHLCVEMLFSPVCAMIAYGSWQAEKDLTRPRKKKPVLQVAPSDPDPLRAA